MDGTNKLPDWFWDLPPDPKRFRTNAKIISPFMIPPGSKIRMVEGALDIKYHQHAIPKPPHPLIQSIKQSLLDGKEHIIAQGDAGTSEEGWAADFAALLDALWGSKPTSHP